MLPLCTGTPLSPGPVPLTLSQGVCASIQRIVLNYDEKLGDREGIKRRRD